MHGEFGLHTLRPGEMVSVTGLRATGSMRRCLMDLGFVPGTEVTCLGRSPSGDPGAYEVRGGAVLALLDTDASVVQCGGAGR